MELINKATGAAEAVVAAGRARAQSIELVAISENFFSDDETEKARAFVSF
jgi:hypothetical protein